MLIKSSCFMVITTLAMGFAIDNSVRAGSSLKVPWLSSNDPSGSQPPRKRHRQISQSKEFAEPTGIINLGLAHSLAILNNPELAAFSWEARIAASKRLQANLIPNPEFETEIENFGGSEERHNFDSVETTFQITQVIELGGKRGKRVTVAELDTQLADWDFKIKRLGVLSETTKAFLHVEAAQKRLSLSENLFSLTNRVHKVVQNSIAAGRVSPLDGARATIEVTTSKIDLDRAKRDLQANRQILAATWGSTSPKFSSVKGNFDRITPVPPLRQLLQSISDNPDLARSKIEIKLRTSELALERSENISDLTLSLGIKRIEEVDDTVFIAGFSIPLPIFGINPGGILGARHRQAQSRQQYRAVELQITRELRESYYNFSFSYRETTVLANSVIPAARMVFKATQRGYQDGKIGLLQVLDAQRTLFEALGRHLEAAENYHAANIEVERLIGGPRIAQTSAMEKIQ